MRNRWCFDPIGLRFYLQTTCVILLEDGEEIEKGTVLAERGSEGSPRFEQVDSIREPIQIKLG